MEYVILTAVIVPTALIWLINLMQYANKKERALRRLEKAILKDVS